MQWLGIRHWRRILAAGSVLLLASACGGDKSPTGPGNGGGNGNDGGITGDYDLASIGKVALGTELQLEDCIPVRFTGGEMWFYDDGTWEFAVGYQTQTGNQEYDDWGTYEHAGASVWLESDYGQTFQGTFDGQVTKLDYDFCPNGQTDIQLVFQK